MILETNVKADKPAKRFPETCRFTIRDIKMDLNS